MSPIWSTVVANWQSVDSAPTAGSENLVKSGGAEKEIKNSVRTFIAKNVIDHTDEYYVEKKIIKSDGTYYPDDYNGYVTTGFISCLSGDYFRPRTQVSTFDLYACFYDSNKNVISSAYFHNNTAIYLEVPNNKDIAFVRISHNATSRWCWYNSKEFFNIASGLTLLKPLALSAIFKPPLVPSHIMMVL